MSFVKIEALLTVGERGDKQGLWKGRRACGGRI